jgi:hypothetical protein
MDHKSSNLSRDFEEVFDNAWGTPQPFISDYTSKSHKDTDLGYFAGLALNGILSSLNTTTGIKLFRKWSKGDKPENGEKQIEESFSKLSISIAKELIKQLDKENR